jgi:phosphatidate cytidylyltransferase
VRNLIIRTSTGAVYVAIVAGGLLHPYLFPLVFSLAVGLTVWEFYGLMRNYGDISLKRMAGTLGGMYLFLACYVYANGWADNRIYLPYLLYLMFTFISEIYAKAPNPIYNWAFMFLGQVYCAASFSLLNFIVFQPGEAAVCAFSPLPVLALFAFVWLNDSGAYLIGTKWGRHRLLERVSPKKSWEGFWGGLAVALAASQVFACFYPSVSWYNWLGLSAVIVVFATWGDLTESLMKRTLGIKDSGSLLPGHGGMLDRFDSVLMAIPALYIYLRLFIQS